METVRIKIGSKEYDVSIAKTIEEKEHGLMGVETLPESQGILFDYSDDPKEELTFWMKDTSIPLDIIFIDTQGVVIATEQGEPNSEEYIECVADEGELIRYVLEVNSGAGIQVGDKIDIKNSEDAGLDVADKAPTEDDSDDMDGIEEISDEEIRMFILDSEGNPVHEVESGVRIFSRIHTRELIRLAKHAGKTKEDSDYKRVGKRLFKIFDIQGNQEPEYVDSPKEAK